MQENRNSKRFFRGNLNLTENIFWNVNKFFNDILDIFFARGPARIDEGFSWASEIFFWFSWPKMACRTDRIRCKKRVTEIRRTLVLRMTLNITVKVKSKSQLECHESILFCPKFVKFQKSYRKNDTTLHGGQKNCGQRFFLGYSVVTLGFTLSMTFKVISRSRSF